MNNQSTLTVDVAIIGGGPAGLAAALGAYNSGTKNILILERDTSLGGILNQCIHSGFGLHRFDEELTGPEYAQKDVDEIHRLGIPYQLNTMVLEITKDRQIIAVSAEHGVQTIQAGAVVLAMGCRERPRGAVSILGTRPSGVFTAGTAQKYVNLDGYLPGKEVVILGSGDIGLIMARRMVLEGAKVKAVIELMPYSGGLRRNIVQCLDDFDIPLYYSHTITSVQGKERLESVTMVEVDENRTPLLETAQEIPCDTLLLSVGLIPENELSDALGVEISPITGGAVVNECLETSVQGVFAAGNVLHVHDLVDFVSEESMLAGKNAAKYAQGEYRGKSGVPVITGTGVRYAVPQTLCPDNAGDNTTVRFRVDNVYRNARVAVFLGNRKIQSRRRRIVSPGEMESITLSKEELTQEPFDSVRIELEDLT